MLQSVPRYLMHDVRRVPDILNLHTTYLHHVGGKDTCGMVVFSTTLYYLWIRRRCEERREGE